MQWALPEPSPLDLISYSFCAAYRHCPLSVSFGRDPRFASLNRATTATTLGNVVHEVGKRIGRHQYAGVRSQQPRDIVKEIWDQETAKQVNALARDWAPAQPPTPPNWPNYAINRTRTVREWVPHVNTALVRGGVSREQWHAGEGKDSGSYQDPGPLPWSERGLHDPELNICGTPDHVVRRNTGIWVLDKKTGTQQSEPADEQVWQLLLYAHLVQVQTGELPAWAAIVIPGGAAYPIPVTQEAVDLVVTQAVATAAEYEASRARGITADMGTPSESACGFCSFREVCPAFAEARDEGWRVPNTLTGEVTRVEGSAPWLHVEVAVSSPSWRRGHRTRVIDVAWPGIPTRGCMVGLSGFRSRMDWTIVRGEWNSLSYIFPDQ